jgi:hypothetical protein
MRKGKKAEEIFTTAMRYPAEGKGLDYSTAMPMSQQTGFEPAMMPKPGKHICWDDKETMRHRSTTNGQGAK